MENSAKYLHTRADGFTETADGQIAVTMVKRTGVNADGDNYFDFTFSTFGEPSLLTWEPDEKLQIFEAAVATGLLSRGWAVHPSRAAIDWLEARYETYLAAQAATPTVATPTVAAAQVEPAQAAAPEKIAEPPKAPAKPAPVAPAVPDKD